MIPNRSPWIAQLARHRPVEPLSRSVAADVAIVGGGIAGVSTAYFLLKNTQKRVVLLEADKVAHGATGHNAGQVVSYFERPFRQLVKDFGLKQAADAQLAIELSWDLLDHIHTEARLKTPLYRFTGYAGCCTKEQIIEHLENNYLRAESRILDVEDILIAEEAGYIDEIPAKYKDLYARVPQADILTLLETNNTKFTSLLSYPKGCMNSAFFTEEVVGYLLATYADRFSLYEDSGVATIDLRDHDVVLTVGEHRVMAGEVVLCTNGFEGFSIRNEGGVEINSRFHHQIAGTVGFMMGYFEPISRPPTAISYLFGAKHNDPYFLFLYDTPAS
jgi:glycine/D-amino acid oxidase-like deaminating enzyme